MKSARILFFIFLAIFFSFSVLLLTNGKKAQAITSHIVISEVEITGSGGTNDEFVELYNPTAVDADLTNWKLTKKTAGGVESVLVGTISGTIKAHGFFLITPQTGYTGSVSADIQYSTTNSVSTNNTVVLYSDAGITTVDKVGFGTVAASETASTTNPAAGKSKERKASSTSTKDTMAIGGTEELSGNGEDTDNNSADFVIRDIPQPQNSNSPIEPVVDTPTLTPSITPSPTPTDTPTPTLTPTPTDTPTPTLTDTPTPTITPTDTPTPTNTPTLTPTNTPTPTITNTPTPTTELTPTLTPTPTATPTPTITPSPIFQQIQFPNGTLTCTWNVKVITIFGRTFRIPSIHCVFQKK